MATLQTINNLISAFKADRFGWIHSVLAPIEPTYPNILYVLILEMEENWGNQRKPSKHGRDQLWELSDESPLHTWIGLFGSETEHFNRAL